MTAALREALTAVFEKLDPEALEEQLGRRAQGVAGAELQARLWNRYRELFRATVQSGDTGLPAVFLVAFARAYETIAAGGSARSPATAETGQADCAFRIRPKATLPWRRNPCTERGRPHLFLAERVGFEPTNTLLDITGIPVQRLRPLGHLSVEGGTAYWSQAARSNKPSLRSESPVQDQL